MHGYVLMAGGLVWVFVAEGSLLQPEFFIAKAPEPAAGSPRLLREPALFDIVPNKGKESAENLRVL
jgi:hypothetical protein